MRISRLTNAPYEHISTEKPTEKDLVDLILCDEEIEAAKVGIGKAADLLPVFAEQKRVLATAISNSNPAPFEKSK